MDINIEERLTQQLAQIKAKRVVVGVSGGRDSSVLLHLLTQIEGITIFVAHVNYHLREEADKEQNLVESEASKYGLRCYVLSAVDFQNTTNIEAWAREVRYDFFENLRQRLDCDAILTAHHRGDQAETVLMRLLDGRALSDARGMARWDERRSLLRPLLEVSSEQIANYANIKNVSYLDDSSNFENHFTRNYLRNSLLPEIAQRLNPRVEAVLAESASRFAADEAVLDRESQKVLRSVIADHCLSPMIGRDWALQWRALRLLAIEHLGRRGGYIGYAAWKRVAEVLARNSSETKEVNLGLNLSLLINGDLSFEFLDQSTSSCLSSLSLLPGELSIPGRVTRDYLNEGKAELSADIISVEQSGLEQFGGDIRQVCEGDPLAKAEVFFDADELGVGKLLVRERSDGDVMRVWRRGKRKVKKLLQERRLNNRLRDSLPLIEANNEIIWVPGVARSEIAPVNDKTNRVLSISYQRSGGSH